jgi:hypothetical protein
MIDRTELTERQSIIFVLICVAITIFFLWWR